MGKRKSLEKADREKKSDKIFNAFVKLYQNQQKDRDFLEHRVRYLQEHIYRMKMEQNFETMKADLKLGLTEREAFIYKHRYDKADDDLSDLGKWLDSVSQKYSEPKSTSDDVSIKGKGSQNKVLRDEVRKLKSDIEKYKLEKDSEISALLAEKSFVWNQYNKMELEFSEKLRKKCDEVERASEKVQLLVNKAEQLQLSNEKLRTESVQKSEEIHRLSSEIELLKSRLGSESPSLPPHDGDTASSCKRGKNGTAKGRVLKIKKESGPVNTIAKVVRAKQTARKSAGGKAPKGSSSFKRKSIKVITIPDTPKLFSSSFKIPKLKLSFSPQPI